MLATSWSGLTMDACRAGRRNEPRFHQGLVGALAASRGRRPSMQRHHARLQHGRTSACFGHDELLKLNSGRAPRRVRNEPRFHRGLSTRLQRRGGGAHACNAITRGCRTAAQVHASATTSCSSLTQDARRAGCETSNAFIGACRRACGVAVEAPKHSTPLSAAAARPHECMLHI
jgi:hypothetical protein